MSVLHTCNLLFASLRIFLAQHRTHFFPPYQFTLDAALVAFSHAALRSVISIPSSDAKYTFHLLEKPQVVFPPLSSSLVLPSFTVAAGTLSPVSDITAGNIHSSLDTPFGIPTLQQWRELWAAWDLVTLGMIPQDMLLQKPIDLRHKCLFYIGHIPT